MPHFVVHAYQRGRLLVTAPPRPRFKLSLLHLVLRSLRVFRFGWALRRRRRRLHFHPRRIARVCRAFGPGLWLANASLPRTCAGLPPSFFFISPRRSGRAALGLKDYRPTLAPFQLKNFLPHTHRASSAGCDFLRVLWELILRILAAGFSQLRPVVSDSPARGLAIVGSRSRNRIGSKALRTERHVGRLPRTRSTLKFL